MDNLEREKYPIGQFQEPENISDLDLDRHIKTIKDFPGVTGKFAFDAKRNPAMDVTVLSIKDGQFVELK